MSSSFKLSSDEASASVGSSSITLSSDEAKDSISSSLLQSSEEVQEVFCDPCTIGEGIEKEALFFCQECKEFLCNECREFHRKVSLTKTHHVSRIDESKTASRQSGKINELSKQLSSITVSGATRKTPVGQTTDSVKSYTKATLTNQFNASIDNDREPCLIQSVLVVDNQIYVTDYNNRKIKLFDMKGQAISQYSVPQALHIASMGKDRIACTSGQLYFNIIDTTGNTLKHVKTVTTNVRTFGICCYNGLIFVSCYSRKNPSLSQIQIFSPEGNLTRRIEPILDGSRVLREPCYISINQRSGTINVSDYKVGVIVLSPAGTVQFVKQVFNRTLTAQGITVDDKGQVYMCGMNTENVMTMSADGSDVSEILNKECGLAQAVEIVGNQLYLCCRGTDIVRVFTLS